MHGIRERIQIGWKWFLSFRKREWTIADYPVRVRVNGPGVEPSIAYFAQILNWPGPAGLGPTQAKAYEQLAGNLEEIRKHRKTMPRPGTHVPIQFASTERVTADPALLDDFIQRVLLFRKDDPVFISDESSLRSFGAVAEVQELVTRISDVYGVDVTDIVERSGNIAEILERIRKSSEDGAGHVQ
jgi:hypothetical protein